MVSTKLLEQLAIKWLPLAFLAIWLCLAFNPHTYEPTVRALIVQREYTAIELGTAFGFLAAAALALWVALDRWRDHRRIAAVLFAGFAVLAFFVCMEEVQWAQPLLGYEIPAAFGEGNAQNEMTLHNLEGPHGQAGWFYLVFCLGAWMLTRPSMPLLPAETWRVLRIDERLNPLVAMIALTGAMKVAIQLFGNPFAPDNPVRWTTEITELFIALWCVAYTVMKKPDTSSLPGSTRHEATASRRPKATV